MPLNHRLLVEIATNGGYSIEDALHHIRCHCRGMIIVCTSVDLGIVVASLEFSQEADLHFSIDRLKHSRFRGKMLTIHPSEKSSSGVKNLDRAIHLHLIITVLSDTAELELNGLKEHIGRKTGGTVLTFHIGRSKTDRPKVTCSVRTSLTDAIQRLRGAKYRGRKLDVEKDHQQSVSTKGLVDSVQEAGRKNNASPAPKMPIPKDSTQSMEVSILLSKLPKPVAANEVSRHVCKHTGGRILELVLSRSSRGGMIATCVIETRIEPGTAVTTLRAAQFRGKKLHVEEQLRRRTVSSTLLPAPHVSMHRIEARPDHFYIPSVASHHEVRHPGTVTMVAPLKRAQLKVVQAIAINFNRFVTMDPNRVRRSQNESEVDQLYQEFLVDRLCTSISTDRRCDEGGNGLRDRFEGSALVNHDTKSSSNLGEAQASTEVRGLPPFSADANDVHDTNASLQSLEPITSRHNCGTDTGVNQDPSCVMSASGHDVGTGQLIASPCKLREQEDNVALTESEQLVVTVDGSACLCQSTEEDNVGISQMSFATIGKRMATDSDWDFVA